MLALFGHKIDKKYILTFVLVIIILLAYFLAKPIDHYFQALKVEKISVLLNDDKEKSLEDCKIITAFDINSIGENNVYFNYAVFRDLDNKCRTKYSLSNYGISKENCKIIMKNSDSFFDKNFIVDENIEHKKLACSKKYLEPEFSTGSLFNENNDFKSQVHIDFNLDFFSDIGEENSQEFIVNRTKAKERLLSLLEVNPSVDIKVDDLYLTQNRAVLNLNLAPLTTYTFKLKKFKVLGEEEIKNKEFKVTTPENKYFGIKIINPLTLYTQNNFPKFQILDYNTDKLTTQIEVCSVSEEDYAKIEVFSSSNKQKDSTDFYSKLAGFHCKVKDFVIKTQNQINKHQLMKKEFDLTDFIEEPNGLYFVRLTQKSDLEFYNRVNVPIFFGVINAHIMMKIGKDNNSFFFVNDFDGHPLINQEISIYLNEFQEYDTVYNSETGDYETKDIQSAEKTNIFSKAIILGRTNKDGILQVNLEDKIVNAFSKTFESWQFDSKGFYESFFVKSKGLSHTSYLTSTWNAGIAPWNFGYSTSYNNDEKPILQEWGESKKYFSHVYTDRKLYLPGEQVYIKGVIRTGDALEIPKNDEFQLLIYDPKGKEILNKMIKNNEFGSFWETINLNHNATLGNYNIILKYGEKNIFYGGFGVEVFQKPKFQNEIILESIGLKGDNVEITQTQIEETDYYKIRQHLGTFQIKGSVLSKYYNGSLLKNTPFTYKVYKQDYYADDYWDDCYYGCYWEPRKEFYTQGEGRLDENGRGLFEINVNFESSYADYKYIVEVTVTDSIGDTITSSNSIVAKLPDDLKTYNINNSLYFETDSKFKKTGDSIKIVGGLKNGKWTQYYNNRYVAIIKRKDYHTKQVRDVNGYTRTISTVQEVVDRVMYVNDENFKVNEKGKLELDYKLDETSEYIFEYGTIDLFYVKEYLGLADISDIQDDQLEQIIKDFNVSKKNKLEHDVVIKKYPNPCDSQSSTQEEILQNCIPLEDEILKNSLHINDFISYRDFISIVTYGDQSAFHPIKDDNKLRVLTEKISYHLGEKAKVLIRLPVSNAKILWTIEKNGVLESELIDVKGNTFFKEFIVDDNFIPNAYIGVMMIDTDHIGIPEYKVGYTEIVVDKTDKKAFIDMRFDKESYEPREQVTLKLNVKDKNKKNIPSELTVMVVDDSLISLMGNVDLNTLEKIFMKLPFSIQTSITNIAMLKNYYFSRMGIVGGSGAGNFKGGDSAVSSRNIFKNTAYFAPDVVTDIFGNAQVTFTLPDNLTNFRVMVISNSKKNYFGYAEKLIKVRKNVILEDKTPLILRSGDISKIGANIFNNSGVDQEFKVALKVNGGENFEPPKLIQIKKGDNANVFWNISVEPKLENIKYEMTVLGNSIENSDKLQGVIDIKSSPVLVSNHIKTAIIEPGKQLGLSQFMPENTDQEHSKVEIVFSNNKLSGIDKIAASLAQYPYGCIEQTVSSTLPNVVLSNFNTLFSGMYDKQELQKNIEHGLARIHSMQMSDGGFTYWQGGTQSDLHITPYVLRSLFYMKESGVEIADEVLSKTVSYLENNFAQSSLEQKTEILWALAYAKKLNLKKLELQNLSDIFTGEELNRHSLIAITYAYILTDRVKYSPFIKENILKINSDVKVNNSYYYWDSQSDEALFTSMLIDFDFNKNAEIIEKKITELYTYDWSNYYYSTQTKNNSFIAFLKYLEKTGINNIGKYTFSIGGKTIHGTLGGKSSNLVKNNFRLSELNHTEKLDLNIVNNGNSKIYVDFIMQQYPKDKLKVQKYSNGMTIKRDFYKVNNESLLDKCGGRSDHYYFQENQKYDCTKILTKNITNNFELNTLYKAKISVHFTTKEEKRNFTIEDYLPGSFRVINEKFKTESVSITDSSANWSWSHIEKHPDVIMANSSYIWNDEVVYEYYFRPEFAGEYTLPPVTGYMMYNPITRANSEFRFIEVK